MSQPSPPTGAIIGISIIVLAIAAAFLLDGRNDFNNVMGSVNAAILGLAIVVATKK